MSGKTTSC